MLPVPSEEAGPAGAASTSGGVSTQRDEDAALALYEMLRTKGGIPSDDLYSAAGLDDAHNGRGWRRLNELGLVQIREGVAEAIDPDAALARAMDQYQINATEQLRSGVRLQRVTEALLSVYRPAVQRETSEVLVEFITEPRRKQRTRLDLSDAARTSCGSMHPGPMPSIEVLEASLEHDRTIMARGVRSRAIYPMSCLHSPKYARYLHTLADSGVELRLVDHAPFDMLTFDRDAAVLAADPERPSEAVIVIRGTALIRSFLAVYEDCWLRGLTLARATASTAEDSEITGQERVIIRLMADGLSDDQIARKLGVHRRTVQRAIAKLMERLNATSRFEAGLKLANDAEFAKTFVVR
ncbi:helix-turn-helix transcriptional regulator [Streptomyces sp. NBC_01198]|uniref:helix-turn-helix transcriptional regulator n=1 Tax=Streptomyces sp. NBC_01198 TaxID=2903769 RepID=UPI002E10F42A|nr:helix-turn-helix transcriptional regulator [Streptomyces sp. NBC_01198]